MIILGNNHGILVVYSQDQQSLLCWPEEYMRTYVSIYLSLIIINQNKVFCFILFLSRLFSWLRCLLYTQVFLANYISASCVARIKRNLPSESVVQALGA